MMAQNLSIDLPSSALRASRASRLWEWFWRGRTLRQARDADRANDADLLTEAGVRIEIADRLVSHVESPDVGSATGTALCLYRDALVLLEAATRPEASVAPDGPRSVAQALSRFGGGAPLDIERALGADAIELARVSETQKTSEALESRALLHALAEKILAGSWQARVAMRQRFTRMTLLSAVTLVACGGVATIVTRMTQPPNFLKGVPFHASSIYPGFSLATGVCDGRQTKIFFHTQFEENPFVDFDMGKARTIGHVMIHNRTDCCDDRAIPFAIEVSMDDHAFKQVARRSEPFREFQAAFPPVTARYVRVHGLRKTWLHLESIAAW
jgi:F5/8 type C domain